jgi:hypothetical protein
MAYINGAFVSKHRISLQKYKHVIENKFLVELNSSSQYNEVRNSKGFSEWFKCKISYVITNLLQWCEVLYPQKDKVYWTMKVADLWDKIS